MGLTSRDKYGLLIIWLLGSIVGFIHFDSPKFIDSLAYGVGQLMGILILGSLTHLFMKLLEKVKLKKTRDNFGRMKRTIRHGIVWSIIITLTALILYFKNYTV